MLRRTVLVGSFTLLASIVGVTAPVAQAASVGTGACTTTVDNAAGVTATVASDGACIITFATASASPTTSAQYATRSWTVPAGITSVDVLVVAGGGGGGSSNGCCFDAGAGGGGGVVVANAFAVTAGQTLSVLTGQGGRGTYCGNGFDGGRSQFSTLTAIGGGRGGGCSVSVGSGGSGGGAHCFSSRGSSTQASGGTASNGTNITSYGQPGGLSTGCANGGGGGGGGATEVGAAGAGEGASGPSGGVGGKGGEGVANSLRTESSIVYGSGGGGQGRWTNGVGGTNAGDGSGTNAAGGTGIDGVDETGGGGGAGWREGVVGSAAGDGGSGVVVVRYYANTAPTNSSAPTVSGTTTNGQTLTGSRGTWSGFPTPTYLYRWKRATSATGVYSNIGNATSLTYTLTDDDIDKYLKFEVTATNSTGEVSEASSATAKIADMVRPTTTTTTTVAPALEIVVVAPSTTVAVGQSQIPVVSSVPKSSATTLAPKVVTTMTTTTTTTTTVPAKSSGTVAPKAPSAPSVVAGSAAVKVGDKTETATVERADNQLVVSAGALKAVVGGLNPDGSQMALDDDGNVRLNTGDTVRIKLAGFKPGTIMEAWLFSNPVLLGTTKVGADGTVTGTFAIPKNAPKGAHRVVIVAQTTDGKPATLAVGINVGEWDSGPGVAIWLIVLPIALAVVGALVVPAQRRRRRLSSVK